MEATPPFHSCSLERLQREGGDSLYVTVRFPQKLSLHHCFFDNHTILKYYIACAIAFHTAFTITKNTRWVMMWARDFNCDFPSEQRLNIAIWIPSKRWAKMAFYSFYTIQKYLQRQSFCLWNDYIAWIFFSWRDASCKAIFRVIAFQCLLSIHSSNLNLSSSARTVTNGQGKSLWSSCWGLSKITAVAHFTMVKFTRRIWMWVLYKLQKPGLFFCCG